MYKQLEKLMQERQITAYKLSKDTGIPQSVISEWKSGKNNPSVGKLIILAKYFDVAMEYFVE